MSDEQNGIIANNNKTTWKIDLSSSYSYQFQELVMCGYNNDFKMLTTLGFRDVLCMIHDVCCVYGFVDAHIKIVRYISFLYVFIFIICLIILCFRKEILSHNIWDPWLSSFHPSIFYRGRIAFLSLTFQWLSLGDNCSCQLKVFFPNISL